MGRATGVTRPGTPGTTLATLSWSLVINRARH
jgi:hypothetical protein